MKLTGKTVLITGASEGIGRSLAIKFAAAGSTVVASARNEDGLLDLVKQNPAIIPRRCDVTSLEDITTLFEWLASETGLDIIINNAGIWQKVGGLETIDDTMVSRLIATNLTGLIYCTKYALPLLRNTSEAAIVNIVSKSGVAIQAGQVVYAATKWGAKGFTDVLRQDLKNSNVHVMGVYQAGTNTQIFAKAGDNFETEKFTEPDDLADMVVTSVGGPAKFWVPELHVAYS